MEGQAHNQKNNSLFTIVELARELQVPVSTIYFWVHRREVPFIKLGRHLRFERDAVLKYFKERTEDRPPTCNVLDSLVKIRSGRESFRRSLKNRDWSLAKTEKE